MPVTVKATFEVTGWDETPFDDGVGVSKLTEALVSEKGATGSGTFRADPAGRWKSTSPSHTRMALGPVTVEPSRHRR